MRTTLTVLVVALVGLFGAVSLGYAAYVVSRDQVGLPVTKLQNPPGNLAPAPAKQRARKRMVPPPPPPPPTTTTHQSGDDHGGRSRGGSGSGRGGGGHGGDD